MNIGISQPCNGTQRLYGVSPLLTVPGQPGHFNHDNTVDAADYVVWRKNTGAPADYDLWRTHYGQSITGTGSALESTPIPEPSSLALLLLLGMPLAMPVLSWLVSE